MLNDEACKEFAFLRGKIGYKFERETKVVSQTKYFNQSLLNYTQMFASNIFLHSLQHNS